MKVDQQISSRFQELLEQQTEIIKTRQHVIAYTNRGVPSYPVDHVDFNLATKWGVSCLHILKKIFGEKSPHYIEFDKQYKEFCSQAGGTRAVTRAFAVLQAAAEDFRNEFLFKIRILVEAEVFDDFLEQAKELYNKGYHQPAAVIAGCVLEDGLRKLCDRNNIALQLNATIDPMNNELVKAGVYNNLNKKKITAWADLRNKAAHGQWDQFNEKDVEEMIRDVRRFMEEHFS